MVQYSPVILVLIQRLAIKCETYGVELVSEGIISSWRGPEEFPIVSDKLVSACSSLSFRKFLDNTGNLDGSFDRQRQGVVCL